MKKSIEWAQSHHRVFFDLLFSFVAFSLAFIIRLSVEYLFQLDGSPEQIVRERYLWFYIIGAPVFLLLTIGCFALAGFYRQEHPAGFGGKQDENWKPVRILTGVLMVPIGWSLLMYYAFPQPIFPRGVTILSGFFVFLFCGFSRLAKYYLNRRLVVQIDHRNRDKVRRVLVIGGAGYVGSQLCKDLLERGYFVRVLDSLLFGEFAVQALETNRNFELLRGDFRNMEMVLRALKGMDAVVHLGGIVGDPACSLDDDFTTDINLTATMFLAEVSKVLNIQRFIFASTCSVYGEGKEEMLSEKSVLNPVSLYARTKIASERVLIEATASGFQPTILRFGTLFGLSPRPRLDLFVNLLTAKAVKEGKMSVFGGSQWRPFVHVRDVCRAIRISLEAPIEKVGGEIFNVGSDKLNYQLLDVAQLIAKTVPSAELVVQDNGGDKRDYKVSFTKFERVFGIRLETSLQEGINELVEALNSGVITDHLDPKYSNLQQTKRVLGSGDAVQDYSIAATLLEFPVVRRMSKDLLKQVVGV